MMRKHAGISKIRAGLCAGMMATSLSATTLRPAIADTDLDASSTDGKCVEFEINGERFSCDRLIAMYTKHSRRTAYSLQTPAGTLQFVGDRGMELPPHDYLLFVSTIVDRNTTRQATGQCKTTRSMDGQSIKQLVCDVTYDGGSIHGTFRATAVSQDISL